MKRRAIPYRILCEWGMAMPQNSVRQTHKRYYAHARKVEPRKRAGFLLRSVCDLWEQQGAARVNELTWKSLN